jgi:hypothetical protein
MNDTRVRAALALGLSLAAGAALMGWLVAGALYRARAADRFVTVKGFAEREVAANLLIWPIVFTVTDNDLASLQRRVEDSAGRVQEFLKPAFPAEEWSTSAPRVTDRQAQGMTGEGRPLDRYVAEASVTVRTGRIDAAREAMRRSGELVKQGVALTRSFEQQTQYEYTGLETIKPEMIAQATRDARRAAEQFAQDSGSRVGAIRNAQQGLFQIEDRDPFSPEFKKIRVVTTVQYFLAD